MTSFIDLINCPEVKKEKNYPPRLHYSPFGKWEIEIIIPESPPKSVADIQFYKNSHPGIYQTEMKIRQFMYELMNIPLKNGEKVWDIMVDCWDMENPEHKFRNWNKDNTQFFLTIGNNGLYPPIVYIMDDNGRIEGSMELPIKEPRTVDDLKIIVKPKLDLKELLKVLRGDDEYDIPLWKSLLVRWDAVNPDAPVWNWSKFRMMYDTEYQQK